MNWKKERDDIVKNLLNCGNEEDFEKAFLIMGMWDRHRPGKMLAHKEIK